MPIQMNIHEAKTNLSKLIEEAVSGGEVIIAKAGTPLVKLVPVTQVAASNRELGWARGKWTVPDDIDAGFEDAIDGMFGLGD